MITRALKNPDAIYPSIRNLPKGKKDPRTNLCWLFVGFNPVLGPRWARLRMTDDRQDHQDLLTN